MPVFSHRQKDMLSRDAAHLLFSNALELIIMLPKFNKFINSVYQYFKV